MRISPETAEPIPRLATLLNDIPPARLFEESLKLLQAGYGYETYKLLCEYHLFQPLFPTITRYFTENGDSPMERIIEQVLKNTDTRIHNDTRVNLAFCSPRRSGTHCWRRHRRSPGKRPDLSRRFRAGDERRAGRSLPFMVSETSDDVNPRYLAVAVAYVPSSG